MMGILCRILDDFILFLMMNDVGWYKIEFACLVMKFKSSPTGFLQGLAYFLERWVLSFHDSIEIELIMDLEKEVISKVL